MQKHQDKNTDVKKHSNKKWQQLKINAYIAYNLGYDTNNCDKHY